MIKHLRIGNRDSAEIAILSAPFPEKNIANLMNSSRKSKNTYQYKVEEDAAF